MSTRNGLPLDFRKNIACLIAGLLRICQVFVSPVKLWHGFAKRTCPATPHPRTNVIIHSLPNKMCSDLVNGLEDSEVTAKKRIMEIIENRR